MPAPATFAAAECGRGRRCTAWRRGVVTAARQGSQSGTAAPKSAGEPDQESVTAAFERRFVLAEAVLVSPMTRALQTAMLAMDGHAAVVASGLTCVCVIRCTCACVIRCTCVCVIRCVRDALHLCVRGTLHLCVRDALSVCA
jgi:hypothetical protein